MQFNDSSFPFRASGAWGSYERRFSSHGLTVEHIRVLPPDSNATERLSWNLTAIWPTVGFLLGIATAVAAHNIASTEVSVVAGAAVWITPWLWLAWKSRGFSRRVHEAWRIEGAGLWMVEPSALQKHAKRLSDASHQSGPDQRHIRLTWRAVYNELATSDRKNVTSLVVHNSAGVDMRSHSDTSGQTLNGNVR